MLAGLQLLWGEEGIFYATPWKFARGLKTGVHVCIFVHERRLLRAAVCGVFAHLGWIAPVGLYL